MESLLASDELGKLVTAAPVYAVANITSLFLAPLRSYSMSDHQVEQLSLVICALLGLVLLLSGRRFFLGILFLFALALSFLALSPFLSTSKATPSEVAESFWSRLSLFASRGSTSSSTSSSSSPPTPSAAPGVSPTLWAKEAFIKLLVSFLIASASTVLYKQICLRMASIVGAGFGFLLSCLAYVTLLALMYHLGAVSLLEYTLFCLPSVSNPPGVAAAAPPPVPTAFDFWTFPSTLVTLVWSALLDSVSQATSSTRRSSSDKDPSASALLDVEVTYESIVVLASVVFAVVAGRKIASHLEHSLLYGAFPDWAHSFFAPVKFTSYIVGFMLYALCTHISHAVLGLDQSFSVHVPQAVVFRPLLLPFSLHLHPVPLSTALVAPIVCAGLVHGFSVASALLEQVETALSAGVGASLLFALVPLLGVELPYVRLFLWLVLTALGIVAQNFYQDDAENRPPRAGASGPARRRSSNRRPALETAYLDEDDAN